MKLQDLCTSLDLEVKTASAQLEGEVSGGYASDLLSDVMANSRAGDLWITLQSHENTVAVALLRDLAGVLLVGGRQPDPETLEKADAEGVPLLTSPQRTFEVVGRLIEAGVPPRTEP